MFRPRGSRGNRFPQTLAANQSWFRSLLWGIRIVIFSVIKVRKELDRKAASSLFLRFALLDAALRGRVRHGVPRRPAPSGAHRAPQRRLPLGSARQTRSCRPPNLSTGAAGGLCPCPHRPLLLPLGRGAGSPPRRGRGRGRGASLTEGRPCPGRGQRYTHRSLGSSLRAPREAGVV